MQKSSSAVENLFHALLGRKLYETKGGVRNAQRHSVSAISQHNKEEGGELCLI